MFVTWIVVRTACRLAARFGAEARRLRAISDAILGLAGSGAASTLASAFGAPAQAGRGAMAIAAFVGAAPITVLQRKIWPSRTLRNVRTTDG
jgi:uncharacterized membrane protein YeaQ/YmgE (transglycosylase-associated protein family)